MLIRKSVLFLLSISMLSAPLVHAAGDAAAGKAKAVMCAACHGSAGQSSNPLWPNLAGQQDAYLMKSMKAFRSGERKDPLMTPMAAALSDDDIANLAAFFSGLK